MSKTNCPNCGAPIDPYECTCPYCKTFYKDIGDIPIGRPFYLRLNIGSEEKPNILVAQVITQGVTATMGTPEIEMAHSIDGHLHSVYHNPSCELKIEFMTL